MDTNPPGGKPGLSNMPSLYWAYGVTVGLLALLIGAEIWFLPPHCGTEKDGLNNSIGLTVLVAGMLGGFVSSITRGNRDLSDPTLALQAPRPVLVMQKLAHVLLGGIFAIVLYLIFAGDMISGSLFPQFTNDKVSSFTDFLCRARPEKIADYAKALVWAFLAGYSQSVMRNLFDDLVSKAVGENGGSVESAAAGKSPEGGATAPNPPNPKEADPKADKSGTQKPD